MFGCHFGKLFQVTVAGGSYQEGLTSVVQGVPPGMEMTEKEIYADMLLRKPGTDELSSPRKEPDLPVIYTGLNAAETIENAGNKNHTNGTPLTILIPNLDRDFVHIKQYQDTNRTPRPGHASYASFRKYGPDDDAIGAGFFSGRYTSTIVSAGAVARKILKDHSINIFSYIKEAAGVLCPEIPYDKIFDYHKNYKKMRCSLDVFYQEIYEKNRVTMDMRFLEKMHEFANIEKELVEIRKKRVRLSPEEIRDKYGVHHVLLCPDISVADEMLNACKKITKSGDSSGGVVEVIALGVPVGLGEPMFDKMDAELGKMLGLGAVKCVEIGAGFKAKDMTGSQSNDQIISKDGKVEFLSNNAGGITGGLTSGQPIVVRLTVKPTPTIDREQKTIDKYTLENKTIAAITRRDPNIVGRLWPVAEAMTAIILLDNLMMFNALKSMMKK